MTNRPRSHQLEDISLRRFENLLPNAWVSRGKVPDYGIDREIEIFELDKATGLSFLVQLRATDDQRKSQKLRLKVEQMNYFRSLDVPVAIIRYCDADGSFFWQWAANINYHSLPQGQKSFVYSFGDSERWSEETPDKILQTLAVRRHLENYPPNASFSVRIDCQTLPLAVRYNVERSLQKTLSESHGVLVPWKIKTSNIIVDISVNRNRLRIEIDCITSVTFALDDIDQEKIANSFLYGFTDILRRWRMFPQAEHLASLILERGQSHYSKNLALMCCLGLTSDPNKATSLALLNGIHEEHDEFYFPFMLHLLRSPQRNESRTLAIERFYAASLQSARNKGKETEAAIHYSSANLYRVSGRLAKAIYHFNQARHLRQAYMKAPYFLQELGACLFGQAHYKCSAMVYEQATAIEVSPRAELHLADALMLSGRVEAALHRYKIAAKTDDATLQAEAFLKASVCTWLHDWLGPVVPTQASEASKRLAWDEIGDESLWLEIMTSIDAINPVINFNLGVYRAKAGHTKHALGHFLLCAFRQSGDLEAWANAIICAQKIDIEILILSIMTAISLAGMPAYDRLRELLLQQEAEERLIEMLDDIVRDVAAIVEESRSFDITLRALNQDKFDIVVVAPGIPN